MQQNPGPAGRRPFSDDVTVHIPDEVTVHLPDGPNGSKPPDGVTVSDRSVTVRSRRVGAAHALA